MLNFDDSTVCVKDVLQCAACHISILCPLLLLYRHYRDRSDETPSHTGGVSDAYLQKVKDKRDRDRGVYASSSKDKDQNRSTDPGEIL